jgi:hypothetical protein
MNCSKDFAPRLRLWSTVKVGCLKYRILEPVEALAPQVVFESIWRDLDAVKVAFGDAWQQPHLPEDYSVPMTAYSVHHFSLARVRQGRTPHRPTWSNPAPGALSSSRILAKSNGRHVHWVICCRTVLPSLRSDVPLEADTTTCDKLRDNAERVLSARVVYSIRLPTNCRSGELEARRPTVGFYTLKISACENRPI